MSLILYNEFSTLIPQLNEIIHNSYPLEVTAKNDKSSVTNLDLNISSALYEFSRKHHLGFHCEEKPSLEWKTPLLIVDPVDGTEGLIAGNDEWSVSVAYWTGEMKDSQAIIWNPTREELFTGNEAPIQSPSLNLKGLVSRSEWKAKYYEDVMKNSHLSIQPLGSIAYKLGLLSAGECDFVVSLKPKNIWDIAAGAILSFQHGFEFYSEFKKVTTLENKVYLPPLVWVRPSQKEKLLQGFKSAGTKII